MAFKRTIRPREIPSDDELVSAMAGIGMRIEARPDRRANIEDTVYFASRKGVEEGDLDTLSKLVTWLDVYSNWLNADRLTRLVQISESDKVRAFWVGVAGWKSKDARFRRLSRMPARRRINLLPENVLRAKASEAVPVEVTQRKNAYLRHRIMMGPTYRSDMWATLEMNPELSPAELARRTYGSFATAWTVKRDWGIVRGRGRAGNA